MKISIDDNWNVYQNGDKILVKHKNYKILSLIGTSGHTLCEEELLSMLERFLVIKNIKLEER